MPGHATYAATITAAFSYNYFAIFAFIYFFIDASLAYYQAFFRWLTRISASDISLPQDIYAGSPRKMATLLCCRVFSHYIAARGACCMSRRMRAAAGWLSRSVAALPVAAVRARAMHTLPLPRTTRGLQPLMSELLLAAAMSRFRRMPKATGGRGRRDAGFEQHFVAAAMPAFAFYYYYGLLY